MTDPMTSDRQTTDIPTLTPELMLDAVRPSRMTLRAVPGPFPLFEIHDALAPDLYDALTRTLPRDVSGWGASSHPMDRRHYLRRGAGDFEARLAASPPWSDLATAMESDGFRADLGVALFEPFRQAAVAGEIQSRALTAHFAGDTDPERFGRFLVEQTEPIFTLTALGPGELNSPHADETRKWLTLLMYLPEHDWQPAWGGYTVFYRAKVPLETARWFDPEGHNRVPPDLLARFQAETEIHHRSSFAPNVWCLFVKTKRSFHAVPPIRCPEGRRRWAVVFNLKGPV